MLRKQVVVGGLVPRGVVILGKVTGIPLAGPGRADLALAQRGQRDAPHSHSHRKLLRLLLSGRCQHAGHGECALVHPCGGAVGDVHAQPQCLCATARGADAAAGDWQQRVAAPAAAAACGGFVYFVFVCVCVCVCVCVLGNLSLCACVRMCVEN